MALGDYVYEDPKFRKCISVVREWGNGFQYVRVVTCPLGKVATEMADALAVGAVIPARLNDDTAGNTTYGPKLQSIAHMSQKDAPLQQLQLTYLQVTTGSVTNGYAESKRVPRRRNLRIFYDTWGVAATTTSGGIPTRTDKLDGVAGATNPTCQDVTLDDKSYPGFVVVRCAWPQVRSYA